MHIELLFLIQQTYVGCDRSQHSAVRRLPIACTSAGDGVMGSIYAGAVCRQGNFVYINIEYRLCFLFILCKENKVLSTLTNVDF